jgi:hypothetical protein
VEAGRLVVEHDVVADRQAHQVRAAGGAEQDLEALQLVLAHARVIGEARVAAHRQAEQLAHEVILERGPRDLRPVLEVLGADEADDGVDQERPVAPGQAVAAGLDRQLIGAVVGRARQRRALAGLEVHDVGAARGALGLHQRPGVVEQRHRHAERAVAGLGAGQRLEHQVHRAAQRQRLHLHGDVGQHAVLGRDRVPLAHRVERREDRRGRRRRVGRRVHADHRVAAAVAQALARRRQDAVDVVGRVVGLDPRRQPARQAQRVVGPHHHLALGGDRHQVEVRHQLAHRRRHLRRQPGRHRAQRRAAGRRLEQPLAELADGQVRDRLVGLVVEVVLDHAGHLVLVVGDDRVGAQLGQRQVGQHRARRDPLDGAARRHPGQVVAALGRVGAAEQLLHRVEAVAHPADGGGQIHGADCTASARATIAWAVE